MSAAHIAENSKALLAVEAEIATIDRELKILQARKLALQLTAHKILSDTAIVSNVYGGCRYGTHVRLWG